MLRRYSVIKVILRDIRGLTIIELLISLALIGIVVALSNNFFAYSTKSIDIASKQTEVQQNALLAKQIIEKKIRLASYLIILKNAPTTPGEVTCEGYVNPEELYFTDSGAFMNSTQEGIKQPLENISGDIQYTLTFEKTETDSKILRYTIKCSYNGEQEYEISSEIAIYNIEQIQEEEAGIKGEAIRYAFINPPSEL